MDLHPGRNVYLTSWFILSVLFLTGHEMSVVPTCVQDVTLVDLPDQLILSVLFLTGDVCGPYICPGSPITRTQNGRNVYLTSWVILSVLFLTGGETSVVPTHDWDPPSHGLPPW